MFVLAVWLFVVAGAIATVRLLLGPGLAERIVALDVALICFMGALACHAAHTDATTYLIAVVVLAIIGFTATVSAARFLQHEGTGSTEVPPLSPPPVRAPSGATGRLRGSRGRRGGSGVRVRRKSPGSTGGRTRGRGTGSGEVGS